MNGTYTYNPANLATYGPDRMRFELGDTMTEGGADTCALCDEEYEAVLSTVIRTRRQWKKAKLRCIESIFRRFAYEADTKNGPVSLSLGDRAKLWQDMYEKLKAELKIGAASADAITTLADHPGTGEITPPYFYNGMMSHEEAEGQDI